MTSLLDQANFANKDGVLRKMRQALLTVAIAVSAEESSGDEIVDRGRLGFATSVLRDPDRWARVMVYGIVTDERIKASASDQVINDVVSALWNAYAGVNPNLGS
jgi:hypothetical protein